MASAARRPDLAQALRLLWGAFLAAAVLYGLLPFLLLSPGADGLSPSMHGAMYSAAAGAAVASFVTRRWWISSIRAALERPHASGPGGRQNLEMRIKAGAVITWSLSEAVALIGMVRAIASHDPGHAVPFVTTSVLLLYLHRPAAWPMAAVLAR